MLGSGVLEVAIGLAYLYLLLSLICMVLNEWIAGALALRAKTLEVGIRNLLDDPEGTGLAAKFYAHPLVKGLGRRGQRMPSYIPSRTFAVALLDTIAPPDPATGPRSIKEIRGLVSQLAPEDFRNALLSLIDQAGGDLARARVNIERWFDDAMDRVSGWYKRRIHVIVACLGLGVSVLLNADTLTLANTLEREPQLLASIGAAPQEIVKHPLPADAKLTEERIAELQNALQQVRLPLGWSLAPGDARRVPGDPWGWVGKILGLTFTGLAVSLGAPFWFDALGKLVSLRASGPPPKRSEQAS